MKKETPVLLLTGYLGSGKTTLLNRILQNRQGIRFAVIVNDIGEVNIDAGLIQQGGVVQEADDSLVALQNGCICCTLKMDLVEQLHDIVASNRFDYIVIEASGICEPAPIAQTICSIPQIDNRYEPGMAPRLDSIVTVVDALRLRDEFKGGLDLLAEHIAEEDIENLVIQQIEFCNIILLNKASEVTPEELERTKQVIRALQPKAEIITCDYGNVELTKLLNTHLFDFEATATSASWIQEVENLAEHDEEHEEHEHHHHHDHEHEHEHRHHHHEEDEEEGEVCPECGHHHHHHGECGCGHHHEEGHSHGEEYGIGTYVYRNHRPLDMARFDFFVAKRWPKGVIRAKGLCYFHDERDNCYLFEQAGKQISMKNVGAWYATMPQDELERFLDANPNIAKDWDDTYGDRMQKLVFIGQNLDKEYIKKELDQCLVD